MNIRSLVLGSVAAFALISGAHATDAVVPDDIQPMYGQPADACDAYGTGFVRMPGTGTCMRVSGQLRYEKSFSQGQRTRNGASGRTTLDFETRSDP